MKFIAACILGLVISLPCNGMSVEAYRNIRKHLDDPDATVRLSTQVGIDAYFQALADTYELMRQDDKLLVQFGKPNTRICLPHSVKITKDLTRLATEAEIDQHQDLYGKTPGWEKVVLPAFTILGLLRMFPCSS